MTTYIRVSDEL